MESDQPVTLPSFGNIKVFLETITIFLGFDSFVDDAVVGEQSELQLHVRVYTYDFRRGVVTDN